MILTRLAVPLIAISIAIATLGCTSTGNSTGFTAAPQSSSSIATRSQTPELVTIRGKGGVRLEGKLHRPLQPSRHAPAVIVLHGYDGSATDVDDSAALLRERGFVSLALSMRGWGASGGEDDCGLEQPDDVVQAARWLAQQPGVDGARIGVLGYSQGGQVALLSAAKYTGIKSVVSFFPVTDVDAWFETTSHPGIPGYISSVCSPRARERSPIDYASSIRASVLLVHGSRDERVPTQQSVKMRDAISSAGGRVQLKLIPDARHAFSAGDWQVAWPAAVQHLDRTLRAGNANVAQVRRSKKVINYGAFGNSDEVIAAPGAPVLSVTRSNAGKTSITRIGPSCAGCGDAFLNALRAPAARTTNTMFVFGAQRDRDIDILATLFCGPPDQILAATASYFDALKRSDFSRGRFSERELMQKLLATAKEAARVNGAKPQDLQECLRSRSFRLATIAAGMRTRPSLGETVVATGPELSRTSRLFQYSGGTGVGPRHRSLSKTERLAREEEVRRGRKEMLAHQRHLRDLDRKIAFVEATSLLISLGLEAVPGGSTAYGTGQLIGNIAMKEWKNVAISVVADAIPGASLGYSVYSTSKAYANMIESEKAYNRARLKSIQVQKSQELGVSVVAN